MAEWRFVFAPPRNDRSLRLANLAAEARFVSRVGADRRSWLRWVRPAPDEVQTLSPHQRRSSAMEELGDAQYSSPDFYAGLDLKSVDVIEIEVRLSEHVNRLNPEVFSHADSLDFKSSSPTHNLSIKSYSFSRYKVCEFYALVCCICELWIVYVEIEYV